MLHTELGHRDRASEQPGEGFIFMALELQSIVFKAWQGGGNGRGNVCQPPAAAEAGLLPATCVIRDGKLKTGQNPEYPD